MVYLNQFLAALLLQVLDVVLKAKLWLLEIALEGHKAKYHFEGETTHGVEDSPWSFPG